MVISILLLKAEIMVNVYSRVSAFDQPIHSPGNLKAKKFEIEI